MHLYFDFVAFNIQYCDMIQIPFDSTSRSSYNVGDLLYDVIQYQYPVYGTRDRVITITISLTTIYSFCPGSKMCGQT